MHPPDGQRPVVISIHAPREGGDRLTVSCQLSSTRFQSTPPARGATTISTSTISGKAFQSTPPARGATATYNGLSDLPEISIHAPREGGDTDGRPDRRHEPYFNPRPPRGGRRPDGQAVMRHFAISIHAPREGGDWSNSTWDAANIKFQSTPPARGATTCLRLYHRTGRFQSTPPARGATSRISVIARSWIFQSTPPARGATFARKRVKYHQH